MFQICEMVDEEVCTETDECIEVEENVCETVDEEQCQGKKDSNISFLIFPYWFLNPTYFFPI